ncbi:GAF and ANTAR domain-containing protein [Microlunatus lacustris]
MTAHTLAQAYADAASRLAGRADVLGNTIALLTDAAALMAGDAAGLLVQRPSGGLKLVACTSHRATELELYERQERSGPCSEAISTGRFVSAGPDDLASRWDGVGQAMLDAGFRRVEAFPVLWQETVLGALNVFHTEDRPLGPENERAGATFATLAALLLARPGDLSTGTVQQQVLEALESRVTLEQAKGVLSYLWKVDMARSYDLLVQASADQGRPLTEVAARIVADAGRRDRDSHER